MIQCERKIAEDWLLMQGKAILYGTKSGDNAGFQGSIKE